MGLRDDILNIDDLPITAVEVPEWGVTVFVREMTGTERDVYESNLLEQKDLPMSKRLANMRAKLVVLCTVDSDGKRIFNDDDIEAVGHKSSAAVSRVAVVAQNLNALTDNHVEEIAEK